MSQTEVRTFRAASMLAALDVVRRELGPDAVILHTRELPRPRSWQIRRSDARADVTAGTGVNVRMPRVVVPPPPAPVKRAPRPVPVADTPAPRDKAPLETSAPHFQPRARHDRELSPPPELLSASRPQSRPGSDVHSSRADKAAARPAPAPAPAPMLPQLDPALAMETFTP